jgi:hypothetical protein
MPVLKSWMKGMGLTIFDEIDTTSKSNRLDGIATHNHFCMGTSCAMGNVVENGFGANFLT